MIAVCRRWFLYLCPRLLLALVAATVAFGIGEVSLRLQELPRPKGEAKLTLEQVAGQAEFDGDFPGDWFLEDPQPLARPPVRPEHVERSRNYKSYLCNCLFNGNLIQSGVYRKSYTELASVKELDTFQLPTDSLYPPYRFPPSVTLPQGLTTNKFGFRGPEVELRKPAHTIRIACVGSSVTCGRFADAFSYPEHLQQFLNRWSADRGLGVNFEVLNAGRAGFDSRSIANVVRYEVLPLDVDYVVYHEGANQVNLRTVLKAEPTYSARNQRKVEIVFGNPPPGYCERRVYPRLEGTGSSVLSRLRLLTEFPLQSLREPSKPAHEIALPAGLDEFAPERACFGSVPGCEHHGTALGLDVIVTDLDQILQDARTHGARMVMSTFPWCVRDGMVLDRDRHRWFHQHLNRCYWPATYRDIERMVALQNRVFRRWAGDNGVELVDAATAMPVDPNLYIDWVHTTPLGTRVRAWIFFRGLVPVIERDLQAGVVPRQRFQEPVHPWINADHCAEWHSSD